MFTYTAAEEFEISVRRGASEVLTLYSFTHIVVPADPIAADSFLATEPPTPCTASSQCLDVTGDFVTAVAGVQLVSKFVLQLVDTYGNLVTPDRLFDTTRLSAATTISDTDSAVSSLTFRYSTTASVIYFEPTLQASGSHSLTVSLDGSPLGNVPTQLEVAPTSASVALGDTYVEASVAGDAPSVTGGSALTFTATVRDTYLNLRATDTTEYITFSVTNKANGSEVVNSAITYNTAGSAALALSIREASPYELTYKVGDAFGPDSPRSFTVLPGAASAATSLVLAQLSAPVPCCASSQAAWSVPVEAWSGADGFTECPVFSTGASVSCVNADGSDTNLGVEAGQSGALVVQLLDEHGNHVTGSGAAADGLSVSFTLDGQDVALDVALASSSGTYDLSFSPTVAGLHVLTPSLGGVSLSSSPVGVQIYPATTDPTTSFVYMTDVTTGAEVICIPDEICGDRILPDAVFTLLLQSVDRFGNYRTDAELGNRFALNLVGSSLAADVLFESWTGGLYSLSASNTLVGNKTAQVTMTGAGQTVAQDLGNSAFRLNFGVKPSTLSGELSLTWDPTLSEDLIAEAAQLAICEQLGDPFWPDSCNLIEVTGVNNARRRRRRMLQTGTVSYVVTAPNADTPLDSANTKLSSIDSSTMTSAIQTAAKEIVTSDPTISAEEKQSIVSTLSSSVDVATIASPNLALVALPEVDYSQAALFYNPEVTCPCFLGVRPDSLLISTLPGEGQGTRGE